MSPCSHQPILNSQQLLAYLAKQPTSIVAELGSITETELTNLRSAFKALSIEKQRVSSFLANANSVEQLHSGLTALNSEVKNLPITEVLSLLENQSKPIVITAELAVPSSPRILQDAPWSNTVDSLIFDNMTTASLSGLWVALFLLVMLGIAISCLFNLKTHDKFARQNLWVGRES